MNRLTIDVGIDLGTTNSAIAILHNGKAEVLRNNENSDLTPSAVAYYKKRLYVGSKAKNHQQISPENVQLEFKRHMGTDYRYTFPDCQQTMTAIEMSAEILKVLGQAYANRLGEPLKACVITVPAAFELPQCQATMEAAKLAGIEQVILLQEPIAAAIAYGFQNKDENVYWLVYDWGGGTFDAALINPKDGMFRVVNHRGDNYLGGKDIDQKIVDQLLVPKVQKETGLNDFSRQNKKWNSSIAKLTRAAEEAKIELSSSDRTSLQVTDLILEGENPPYDFEGEITRDEIARLCEPLIDRTIQLCKELIAESKIRVENIEKLILVGGPTKAPYVRERLADPKYGLGISIEHSIDPMTVVAQGAAIFAGTQKLEIKPTEQKDNGHYNIEFTQYDRIGNDPEPFIGGKVIPPIPEEDLSGYSLEFTEIRGWSSGSIPISAKGSFSTTLHAVEDGENIYQIQLFDRRKLPIRVTPDKISYIVGNAIAKPILIHSVGVALNNNQLIEFLRKGELLPAKRKDTLYTANSIRAGEKGSSIRIPIVEGEYKLADRNLIIGYLEVSGEQITRDVPARTEIEITIEVNESRIVSASAYIPLLDLEIEENVIHLQYNKQIIDLMFKSFQFEKKRYEDTKNTILRAADERLLKVLWDFESRYPLSELEDIMSSAKTDADSVNKAERRLLEYRIGIDRLEEECKWELLRVEAYQHIRNIEAILPRIRNAREAEKRKIELTREFENALQHEDEISAKKAKDDLFELFLDLYFSLPESHEHLFNFIRSDSRKFSDQRRAEQLLVEGQRAINNRDINKLIEINSQLLKLLPEDEQKAIRAYGSTVIR